MALKVKSIGKVASASDNLYCNVNPSEIDKVKFSILRLFSSKESRVLLDSFKQCHDLSKKQIITNYSSQLATQSCIKDLEQDDFDKALKDLKDKWAGKKYSVFALRYKRFKRETKAAIIIANLINSYRKSFNKLPGDDYIWKFKESILKKLNPEIRKVKYKGISFNTEEILSTLHNNYSQVLVNSYIEDKISQSDFSQIATDKGVVDSYKTCMSSELIYPNNSYENLHFMEKADVLCGGKCQNHCSDTPIFTKRKKCLDKISSSKLEQVAKENFVKVLKPNNVKTAVEDYKQCISQISSMINIDRSYFCQKDVSSKIFAKESIENLKKFTVGSEFEMNESDEKEYTAKITKCLTSSSEVTKKAYDQCREQSDDLVLSSYFKEKIETQSSQIRRRFNVCSDNYFYNVQGSIDRCIKLSLDEIQKESLKLNHEFDESSVKLSKTYAQLSSANPFKAIDLTVSFYSKTIRPDYKVNSDANYCRRSIKFVNTIVFHHTATSLDKSAVEINNEHLSRGSSNDPWLMIGYHYLIQNPTHSNNINDVNTYQGRELDVIGAHAGSSAYNSNYPNDLYQQALTEKFSCGSRDTSFSKTEPEVSSGKLKVNATSIAIAFVGNFAEQSISNPGGFSGDDPKYPADSSLRKAAEIACMLQKNYPNIKKLGYHRMYRSTECPGEVVEKMSTIKQYAKELGCEF